ncbi:uncharacterized protein LOC127243872 [Andrographis paniculata]|uniref:uncharacterized protein LOC127243872 n=1 Tax=Andrographis paniculata TaxID=175694 RepID=UPI0021E7C174|nr:uncharacterized protein LOC127243872 [Andrographis paniculata]
MEEENSKIKIETKPNTNSLHILEKGDIFFFYRPKVAKEAAHGESDVQQFYLFLRPQNSGGGDGSSDGGAQPQAAAVRYIIMGRKRLPEESERRPFWGFVQMVTKQIQHLKDALKGEIYETTTKGQRHLPDARAAGEGVYSILSHNRGSNQTHTHLVYKLEFPVEGNVEGSGPQEALNIAREASFIIQIKNPDHHVQSGFRGLDKKRKAVYPARLQGIFGHRRYHPADPPDFLDYEGCEFLLISASDDLEQELGLEIGSEGAGECSDLVNMLGESTVATQPLFEGTWI